ncbi:MAG TPA: ATP-grasp domain-containing protein [Niabella sp.]|jgi:biotin carboxylase|nr:ATP-grasp domain-containing protein [Chitinophagaceae bacterium]HRN49167.1 ATP-grasp domain-containing protein [Niabella sp.]HRO83803.1 ATP-grasp domain-containing protein [Niabella sp.]HUN03194.1 ATP-grasp domain-containing protein [Niabella sp.]
MKKTIVCIASYFKGNDFLIACKEQGNQVIFITSESLKEEKWAWSAIDEIYYMPEVEKFVWNMEHFVKGFSFLMRTHNVDAVVALDDFDVEKAAMIREVFRIPGMGQTTYRYFRDKLAMRQKAAESGISIPQFTPVFNDNVIGNFIKEVPAPWIFKPRAEASAIGIKKINNEQELWDLLNSLGEERINFLMESFKPGDVFHVDSLVYEDDVVFSAFSRYLATPMKISHEGGVFRTVTLAKSSDDTQKLDKINKQVLSSFGIKNGATHSEYIKGEDGRFYFLETSSRIGGAHIPDMIEAATGVNVWKEWAKLETAILREEKYTVEETKNLYAGLLISLAKEEKPDTKPFECAEVNKFLEIKSHIGIVYQSDNADVIINKINEATDLITKDLLSIMPPKTKPSS